jgi:hypothetical protein
MLHEQLLRRHEKIRVKCHRGLNLISTVFKSSWKPAAAKGVMKCATAQGLSPVLVCIGTAFCPYTAAIVCFVPVLT